MPSVGNVNKLLRKSFGDAVTAETRDGCIVLSGELERWGQVVTAGLIAASEKLDMNVINDITCTQKEHPVRHPRFEDSQLEFEEPDVLIIGGGIIGCAVARELSKYSLSVLLVEKEHDVAMHATGHSTGLVHSGMKLQKGSLKQWYTINGNRMLEKICSELSVPFRRCGQYMIYRKLMLKPFLFISQWLWRLRGLKGATIVSGEQVREKEPGVSPNLTAALYLPTGAIVDPHALAIAYAENAVQNGVLISLSTIVKEMTVEDGVIKSVSTNRGTIHPKVVVNAAGVFCENIAKMADDRFYSIHPVKGTNVVIDGNYANKLIRGIVSIPEKSKRKRNAREMFSSVLKTTGDTAIVGSFFAETMHKEDFSTDHASVDKTIEQAQQIIPELDIKHAITYFSGVAAATYNDDFIVSRGRNVSNLIHAAGIQFPGVTASPAIAEEIVSLVSERFGGLGALKANPDYNPTRVPAPVLSSLDAGQREQYIDNDPDYGIIICRCRQISKGEIIDALDRPVKCNSIDSVKRRTHAGYGNCQGQCCTPAILEIISAETRQTPQHIHKSDRGSELVYGSAVKIALQHEHPVHAAKSEHDSDVELIRKLHEIEHTHDQKQHSSEAGDGQ